MSEHHDSEVEMSETVLSFKGSRSGAVAGIASAVLFLVGTAILNVPTKATDEELVRWWSSNSHQLDALVSMISFTLAGLLFVVFLAHLRTRLLAAEGDAGTLTTIVYSAGLLFVATLLVAAAARGVIAYAIKSPAGDQPLPSADLLRYLPQISYVVLGFGGLLSAALAICVTSLLAFRTHVFGRLIAWLGVLCAAGLVGANAALVGIGAIPAVLVWTIATSVALGRGDTRTRAVAAAETHGIAGVASRSSVP